LNASHIRPWIFVFLLALATEALGAQQPIWQLGTPDDKSAELTDYKAAAARIEIPAGRQSPDAAAAVPKGLHGTTRPSLEIVYQLDAVPSHGAMFSFKLLHATKNGPQMAVFSNGLMAGLVQLWGTAETDCKFPWKKTYRLYVPKELLVPGRNVLTLKSCHPMWSDTSADARLWWEWDYLRLERLTEPVREPVHGTVAYLGTTLKHSANDFFVNDDTLRFAPVALEWMGIAYCGNTIRTDFWYDVAGSQPRRLEYLKLLRDWNMTVAADNMSSGHFHNLPDGSMPPHARDAIRKFFAQYGNLIQWYEIANEPCMFSGGMSETLNTARCVNEFKPAHVKTTAPGWAYGGGHGTPINWDADVANRRRIESLCQATNGHSYGFSYADNRGGSFVENLKTFGGVEDGWPKEFITTETGTNNWHSEENGTRFASTQPHAQAFDRILRAHLAVVDRTMQHAAIFDDFGLFQGPADWKNLAGLRAFPGQKGEDSRLKTYRRLALAYATHGAPLPYVYLKPEAVRDRMVYFRGVDTAALPALPGSGGTSDRVLLSFVNFENRSATMEVRVTMPQQGTYRGRRFGAEDTYQAARKDVELAAGPALDLTVALGPGESVQYILSPPGPSAPYPPTGLSVSPGNGEATLQWAGSCGATQYTIQRSAEASGPYQTVGSAQTPTYRDSGLQNGKTYYYKVSAGNTVGHSEASAVASATAGAAEPPAWVRAAAGNRRVVLTFATPAGATTCKVYRGGTVVAQAVAVSPRETTFTDTGMDNDTSYSYTVSAVGATSEGPRSEPVAVTPHAPPAAPSGVRCTAGDRRVVVAWNAVPGATEYRVKRAAADGPFAVLAEGLVTPTYTDDTVTNGAGYRYVVAAMNEASEGADSAAVAATLEARSLPEGWKATDIGEVRPRGQASLSPSTKTFTVAGSGSDLWGSADGLCFVYLPLSGDGSLTAHVVGFDDTHEWARCGLMIRQSLEAGSANASMTVTPSRGSNFVFRTQASGPCDMVGGNQHHWLKITRTGATITGYVSDDGRQWTVHGKAQIPMTGPIYLGLCVCSHQQGRLNKAMFDHVEVAKGSSANSMERSRL
jgi:regulation of enolase protein 1 (concanavalin A-like superfamily)